LSREVSRPAYVAIGSNLAGPRRQVEQAFDALAGLADTRLVRRSGLWRSRPMGPQDQPEFVNAAAGLLTTLGPRELLHPHAVLLDAMRRVAVVAVHQPRGLRHLRAAQFRMHP